MQADVARIADQQHAPRIGKFGARDDRRRRRLRAASAVDHDAAELKEAGAEPGARAARHQRRVGGRVIRQVLETAQRRAHRERQLGAGAQARMGGNRFLQRQPVALRQAKRLLRALQQRGGARGFGALDAILIGAGQGQPGRRRVERKADAPELAPKPAVHVEKTQMQPGAGRDAHLCRHAASFGATEDFGSV